MGYDFILAILSRGAVIRDKQFLHHIAFTRNGRNELLPIVGVN